MITAMSFEQEDKGALLYHPEGAEKEKKLAVVVCFSFAAVFGGLAALFIPAVLHEGGTFGGFEPPWGLLGLAIPVICFVLAVMFVVLPFKFMPFRIYERGVTMVKVPFRDGLAGREIFVPAGEIAKVTYETTYQPRGGPVEHFRFHRLDGEGFNAVVEDGDLERVTGLLRDVLTCEVEGPENP